MTSYLVDNTDMKPKKFEYETELFAPERGGVYAAFPFNGKKEFGTNGPVRVECWVDGIGHTGSLLPMGGGQHAIYVKAEIRKAIGKSEGDKVHVVLQENLTPRKLDIPEGLQWFLDDDPELKKKFEKLSFSTRQFIIAYLDEPKQLETKAKRLEDMLRRIQEGFRG